MIMNIKLIKEKWMKFYKRGFLTGIMVLSFFCIIDQTLKFPFFFSKIDIHWIMQMTYKPFHLKH